MNDDHMTPSTPPVLDDTELLQYARQILLDGWDIDAQMQLKSSYVIIIGMGGLGCPVAQTLVRAGLGALTIIDHDVIDISNLQRQSLYTADDIGKPKAAIARSALNIHNANTNIEAILDKLTLDNAAKLIHSADLVIDCTDNFAVRDLINQTCQTKNLALLSTSAIAEVGQIALYTAETGCYRCVFGDDVSDDETCVNSGVLASTVAVIGAMASQAALSYLGKGINPIANKLLVWQGASMTLKHMSFTKDPACSVCGA